MDWLYSKCLPNGSSADRTRTARTDASAFVPVEKRLKTKKLAIELVVIDANKKDGKYGLRKINYSKQKHTTRK